MTRIRVSEVHEHDSRDAVWWCDADGQPRQDLSGETAAEAKERLLDECSTAAERAQILAGSLEVEDADEPERFYEWTVKIRVAATWVADGFDLDADRLYDMVANDLSYARGHEIETEIVASPPAADIRYEQGFQD